MKKSSSFHGLGTTERVTKPLYLNVDTRSTSLYSLRGGPPTPDSLLWETKQVVRDYLGLITGHADLRTSHYVNELSLSRTSSGSSEDSRSPRRSPFRDRKLTRQSKVSRSFDAVLFEAQGPTKQSLPPRNASCDSHVLPHAQTGFTEHLTENMHIIESRSSESINLDGSDQYSQTTRVSSGADVRVVPTNVSTKSPNLKLRLQNQIGADLIEHRGGIEQHDRGDYLNERLPKFQEGVEEQEQYDSFEGMEELFLLHRKDSRLTRTATPMSAPLTPQSEVARQIMTIGDQVQSEYGFQFRRATDELLSRPRKEVSYVVFSEVVDQLVPEDMTDEKKVSFFLEFSRTIRDGMYTKGEQLGDLVDYTAQLIMDRTASYIIKAGGWHSIRSSMGSETTGTPDTPPEGLFYDSTTTNINQTIVSQITPADRERSQKRDRVNDECGVVWSREASASSPDTTSSISIPNSPQCNGESVPKPEESIASNDSYESLDWEPESPHHSVLYGMLPIVVAVAVGFVLRYVIRG